MNEATYDSGTLTITLGAVTQSFSLAKPPYAIVAYNGNEHGLNYTRHASWELARKARLRRGTGGTILVVHER